jgi:hypothetical protein
MLSKKFALVLGNGAYAESLVLGSPTNDARSIVLALQNLKFHVAEGLDLGFDGLNVLIDEFIDKLESERADIGLFYYSGHGLQVQNQNFLVPLDFDAFADLKMVKLIRVQDIIDRIAKFSMLQIVLLDACRNNFDAQQFLRSKGICITADKKIYVGGTAEPVPGLAEMNSSGNTFIAFAAAPGDVAYEGISSLSPFTEAFVKYLDVVDLPLSNLMSRVRQDVLKLTNGRQRTWDHSSLVAPFFFNPGSMFLFMGNAMALLGLFLSFAPYSLMLASPEKPWSWIATSALFPLVSLSILMFGMQTVYSRLRGYFQSESNTEVTVRDHLIRSLEKGTIGGYLGSSIAALCISYPYYRVWETAFDNWVRSKVNGQPGIWVDPPEPFGELTLEITLATALAACILGFLSLFFARVDLGTSGFRLSHNCSSARTLAGSAIGGAVAGVLTAPVLMWYFAFETMSRPKLTPEFLLPEAILGTSIIVFSIVNFDFERLNARRLLTSALGAVVAVLFGGLATALIFGPLYFFGFVTIVINWLASNSADFVVLVAGGAIYGIPVGLVLGLVIGIATLLTKWWSGKPVFSYE